MTEPALQRLDPLADRGRRDAQPPGRRVETALVDHGHERVELRGVELHDEAMLMVHEESLAGLLRPHLPTVEDMPLLAGFATALSLIVAIGAQNAFVLRQGLRREHVLPVVLTCALSDALLIAGGIAGLGALLTRSPTGPRHRQVRRRRFPLRVRRSLAARRAFNPGSMTAADHAPSALRSVVLDLPRLHLPQPTRLPRHRRTPRLTGQPTRHRRPLALRHRRRHRQLRLVLLPGLLLPQTLGPSSPAPAPGNSSTPP